MNQTSAKARLIRYAKGYVAFAPHVSHQIVEDAEVIPVPLSAYYGLGLIEWQDQLVPLISLDSLIYAYPTGQQKSNLQYTIILSYTNDDGTPGYGALALLTLPTMIDVSNDSFCALPSNSDIWPSIAISCFQHAGITVPILDAKRLFSQFHG